ncbi:hypothetical protein DFH28DRAFT_879628, partial [Melampsora americana]
PSRRIYKCTICKQPGHRANRCPNKALSDTTSADVPTSVTHTLETSPAEVITVTNSELSKIKPNFESTKDSEDDECDPNLCPFCDDPLPAQPSSRLTTLKSILFALPNIRKQGGHPNAMSLPFPQTASFCALHNAEKHTIPMGICKGWPTSIDWVLLER